MRHSSLCTHEFCEHTLASWEPQGEGVRLILKRINLKASNHEALFVAKPALGVIAIGKIVFNITTTL